MDTHHAPLEKLKKKELVNEVKKLSGLANEARKLANMHRLSAFREIVAWLRQYPSALSEYDTRELFEAWMDDRDPGSECNGSCPHCCERN